MDDRRRAVGWGIALIVVGGFLLLRELDLWSWTIPDLSGPVFLLLLGFGFVVAYLRNRTQWGYLIPGIVLLAIGVQSAAEQLAPGAWSESVSGLVVMGGIGLAFIAVYAVNRDQWWALIPGGTMVTIGVTSVVEPLGASGADAGWVFFLGLAITFAAVWRVADQVWAIWPAGGLLAMAVVIGAGTPQLLPSIGAIALILGGLVILFQAVRSTSDDEGVVPFAPTSDASDAEWDMDEDWDWDGDGDGERDGSE